MSQNPLQSYYRIPGYQLQLPSGGVYYKNTETSMSNEVEIFPFTAKDELYLTNPDSLLNGSALENVIRSCAPGIKERPGKILMADLDAILLAAKFSTYGDDLNLESVCPKCGESVKFSVSISELLTSTKFFPNQSILKLDSGLVFYLKPIDLESATAIQMAEFNEASAIKSILNEEIPLDQRTLLLKPSINNMVNTAIDVICYGIEKIVIEKDNIEVTERRMIKEFISNIPAKITEAIKKKQEEFNEYGIPKTTEVKCSSCNHVWQNQITLDPSSFFA